MSFFNNNFISHSFLLSLASENCLNFHSLKPEYMRKPFLVGVAAMSASLCASAIGPHIYENLSVSGLSPDGKTAVCTQDGSLTLIDLENGHMTLFEGSEDSGYTQGCGNCFSDNGIIVGSTPAGAAYLKNGVWHALAVPHAEFDSSAQGISPDGSIIVGIVSTGETSLKDVSAPLQIPAIWKLQTDGTYSDWILLPYPEKDFSGRVPQGVTALSINDDGTLIAGQIIDYSGSLRYLITYTPDDAGNWTYSTTFSKMINPDNVVFPECPGNGPEIPFWEDFMNADSLAAYNDALAAWNEEADEITASGGSPDYSTYPAYEDFATDKEKTAYLRAYAQWEAAYPRWQEEFIAFQSVFRQCRMKANTILPDNLFLSPDGRKIISSTSQSSEYPDSWAGVSEAFTPVIMDLDTKEYDVYPADHIIVSSLIPDGTILGYTEREGEPRKAMVYTPGSKDAMSLLSYYETNASSIAEWVNKNMVHDAELFNWTTGDNEIISDMEQTGKPFGSKDMSVIATAVSNLWERNGIDSYTYVLPGAATAVKDIIEDNDKTWSISTLNGGEIAIEGGRADVTVHDTYGRIVFEASESSGRIRTGLAAGTYIIRATGEGKTETVKAIF